jgi:hypothetical protein
MSATLLNDETLSARDILNVVVLYDDRASRDHVLRIRDHLIERFGGELEVVCSWWKLDFLAEPGFAVAATKEVDNADVVLFSLHSSTVLPAYVQSWLEKSISKSRGGRSLLALLGSEDSEAEMGDVDDFLNALADRAGVDYLGMSATGGASELEFARRSIAHRADTRTSVMDNILSFKPPVRPRWGINE